MRNISIEEDEISKFVPLDVCPKIMNNPIAVEKGTSTAGSSTAGDLEIDDMRVKRKD